MTTYRWLTPAAPAAIAVIRLESADFLQDHPLTDRPLPGPGRARFARLLDRHGAIVDEVVVARLGPTVIDFATHGGIGIRAGVETALRDHGFLAADAAQDTADASLWSRLARSPAPAPTLWLMQAAAVGAGSIAITPPFPAVFLTRAPVILITGAVNAGKSTLINAWCGRPRAIVSNVPGTTRDLLAAEAIAAGWHLTLLDSAGLRDTHDPLEGAGQALAIAARAHADLVLHLHSPGDHDPIPGALVVLGKADLRAAHELDPHLPHWSAQGLPGRSPAQLIDALGHAVLERFGIPANITPP